MRLRLSTGILTLLLMALAACGGSSAPIGLVASSPGSLEVGSQRVLLGLVDPESQEFLASADLAASATFTGPGDQQIGPIPLEFVWAIPEVRGLYKASVELTQAGGWTVSISAEGMEPTPPTPLLVEKDTSMPQVGDAAPSVATRTGDDFELAEISSDTDPDPDLYRLSLDEALADQSPTVVVFATPAFCTSQTCGPVLDVVKQAADRHPNVDFVHVEVYENLDATSFEDLETVEAVDTWSLPSEPWVFVTDSQGTITARFEGTVDPDELAEALEGVTTG